MDKRTCHDFESAIDALGAGRLRESERLEFEAHLGTCPACASELAFRTALRAAWSAPDRIAPPSELTHRIAASTYRRRGLLDRWLAPSAPLRWGMAAALLAISVPVAYRLGARTPVTAEAVSGPIAGRIAVRVPVSPVKVPNRSQTVRPVGAVAALAPGAAVARDPWRPLPARSSARTRNATPIGSDLRDDQPARAAVVAGQTIAMPAVAAASNPGSVAVATRFAPESADDHGGNPVPITTGFAAPRGGGGAVLALGDDETEGRAAYQAGLSAQSDASRASGVVAKGDGEAAATRLSVVQAPVVTSNR